MDQFIARQMEAPPVRDAIRIFTLIIVSLLALPISLGTVICNLVVRVLISQWPSHHRQTCRSRPDFKEYNILVTGVGMAKGLTLARAFYLCGHNVIGADFETHPVPCSGRFSASLSAFYSLEMPGPEISGAEYIEQLITLIEKHSIRLWVSCSGVASALEDAEAKEAIELRTKCKCIQFDIPTTATLHGKGAFMRHTRKLGLQIPETHDVASPAGVIDLLEKQTSGKKFILKPVGVDDAHRADMTPLPRATPEATEDHVFRLPISPTRPWILQQFVPGGKEFCTHAVVIDSEVRAFVACPSKELLMHYTAIPPTDPLSKAMLSYTTDFVARSGTKMTGHLSFDFMVEDHVSRSGVVRRLYAIECNPRAHTAVVLFGSRGVEMRDMVKVYLSLLDDEKKNGEIGASESSTLLVQGGLDGDSGAGLVELREGVTPRYWIGHDVVTLVLHPLWKLVNENITRPAVYAGMADFATHVLLWKEGTFEWWDPLPFLALYHVYWPLTIFHAWKKQRKWNRVNVSTTKVFEC